MLLTLSFILFYQKNINCPIYGQLIRQIKYSNSSKEESNEDINKTDGRCNYKIENDKQD